MVALPLDRSPIGFRLAACMTCAPRITAANMVEQLPNATTMGNGTFHWETLNAYQGKRVVEMRRAATPSDPNPGKMMSNIREQGLGQSALILVFVFLTLFDVIFNISRGFICALPGDLCAPVVTADASAPAEQLEHRSDERVFP